MSGDHDRMMAAAKVIADAEGAAWEAEDFAEPWMVGLAHSHYLDIAERAVAAAVGVREAPPTGDPMSAHHDDDATASKVEITVNDEGYIRANGSQIGWVDSVGLPLLRAVLAAAEAPPTAAESYEWYVRKLGR